MSATNDDFEDEAEFDENEEDLPENIRESIRMSREQDANYAKLSKINKSILADDSPVAQLRKAIEAMHMNQRVVSAKISFTELDPNKQRYEPTISIDGA